MKISACIITFNEEENIHAACESVSWADEIVVVDSESTDATVEIARDLRREGPHQQMARICAAKAVRDRRGRARLGPQP